MYLMLVCCIVSLFVEFCNGQMFNDTQNLFNNVMNGYNSKIRPGLDHSKPIEVTMDFYIVTIREFNEVAGTFSVVGVLDMRWVDHRISWDPAIYGNTTSLLLEQRDVWKPLVLNSKLTSVYHTPCVDDCLVRYFPNGLALWKPEDVFDSICEVDVRKYPFDIQMCDITFIPWGYSTSELILVPTSGKVFTSLYTSNGVWNILWTNVSMETTPYQRVRIEITFSRKSEYFVMTMILPISLIQLLNIAVFKLPAESGERITHSLTVLLSITVYLTAISESMPKTSDPSLSYVNYLLLAHLGVSALIVLCTIITLRLYLLPGDDVVPKWASVITEFMHKITCRKITSKETPEENIAKVINTENLAYTDLSDENKITDPEVKGVTGNGHGNSDVTVTWFDFANALDTIFCALFLVLYILANAVYFYFTLKN